MTTYELHPGLAPVERALDRVEAILPVETPRARRALAETLAPITLSIWPEISHRMSRLTNTGLPVDFSWSSRYTALRWTAEVAGPETPRPERLGIASRLAQVDTGWLAAIQPGGRLRAGALLGGRHHGDDDALKVYGDFPTGVAAPLPVQHAALEGLGLEWRFAGIATDGTIEFYGRGYADRAMLDGCEERAYGTTGEWRAAIARLTGSEALPRPALVSVAVDAAGEVEALTWFSFAQLLFPGHDETVAALEQWCADDTGRRLLHALTGGPDDGRWRVSMIGARLGANGSTSVQASIRPS